MSTRPESNLRIVIDIETWGGTHQPTADDIYVPGNYKKPDAIAGFIEKELPLAYGKQALNSLKGEIACIGVAKNEEPAEVLYRSGSEEELMKQFNAWLLDKGVGPDTRVWWVGKNIIGFDLPWILHRAWKYNLPSIASLIPTKKYDEHLIDVQVLFAGPDTTKYRLEDMAEYLGLPCKEGMSGADVPQAYLDGRHEEIATYCAQDVEVTRKIAKILQPWFW